MIPPNKNRIGEEPPANIYNLFSYDGNLFRLSKIKVINVKPFLLPL